jgi:Type I restriction modification DNA specificity domain
MSKLIPLKELFNPVYGVNLELVNIEECSKQDEDSIRFVSRTELNNGVSAYARRMEDVLPNPAHTISVAVSGSVLSSFYQDKEYYSGRDLYYLIPKRKMSREEMIFYALCIKANKYKYNYGRAANKTLKEILLPSEMPKEFQNITIDSVVVPKKKPLITNSLVLNTGSWEWYEIQELFEIKKGKRLTKEDMIEGNTPFIGSIDSNNGYREHIGQEPIHSGNTITVNYNGSVAEAFYQPKPFWASDDVNVLYPKFKMNPFNALFIATIIKAEKYRFNYGRKWHVERMNISKIKLPVTSKKQPDFEFMEDYIKSLPYSASI